MPGISAAFAAASALGASLTSRGVSRSVVFVTPSTARDGAGNTHWAEAAAAAETAVIYMGALQSDVVCNALTERGVPHRRPVALIESASTANERIVRGVLGDLPALVSELGDGPSIMIIGDAVAEARAAIAEASAA